VAQATPQTPIDARRHTKVATIWGISSRHCPSHPLTRA
jgi:hypothetical protein